MNGCGILLASDQESEGKGANFLERDKLRNEVGDGDT